MGLRALKLLAVEEDVYFFVVERDEAGDGLQLAGGEVVGPGEVRVNAAANLDRPVAAGGALVRALGDGVGRGSGGRS